MKRISSKNYLSGLRVHLVPALVWLGTVVFVVALFSHRSRRYEILGIAEVQVRQVAATCDGRLKSVPLQLFEKVNKGDTVAVLDIVLDDELIDEQLDTLKAQQEYLEAQLTELRAYYDAEIINRISEWVAEMRAFTADVVTSRLRFEDLNILIENDREILGDLELEIKRLMTDRTQTDDSAFYQLRRLKENQTTQTNKIKASEALLAKYQKELDEAVARKEEYGKYCPEAGTDANEALHVIYLAKMSVELQMDELRKKRKDLVLRAPCDGFVSQIQCGVGDAVMAGTPIVTITEDRPTEIIAYASEEQAGRVEENMEVEIVKRAEPAQIVKGARVAYLGSTIEQMPMRLWRNPNVPQWGRPILIKIHPDMKLIQGEVVGIRGI